MLRGGFIVLAGLALLLLTGCAHEQEQVAMSPTAATTKQPDAQMLEQRNNAASLLYDLLNDEKNVNKLLYIKRADKPLKHLVDAIAHSCGDAQKQMDDLVKADPALNVHALELPAGEVATRKAIAKTKEHELLFNSGEEFQFQLLLTQTDALSYGWHLAQICADNSTQPEEVREFKGIRVAMEDLYGQVVTMLKTEPASAH